MEARGEGEKKARWRGGQRKGVKGGGERMKTADGDERKEEQRGDERGAVLGEYPDAFHHQI